MKKEDINTKIKWLLDMNQKHSQEFIRTQSARRDYRKSHPTEVRVSKCMDGRVNFPVVVGMPIGVIRSYRNIGGYFDLGWPRLGKEMCKWFKYCVASNKKALFLITYHYSKDDPHKGCAGFNYNSEHAFDFTVSFHRQFKRFLNGSNQITPIVVGLETNTDALIFHPQDPTDQNTLFCSSDMRADEDYLLTLIDGLYPDMDETVKRDLLPFIQGNISHIREVEVSNRKLTDMKHKEWILGVGDGFDWFNEPNNALIVAPFSPDLSTPIMKSLDIISDNMKSGSINDDGFLVLTSGSFTDCGLDENRAIEQANFFRSYVGKILIEKYPELAGKAKFLAVTIDENTRELKQVPEL